MTWDGTKEIQCPFCKKNLTVYWGSFLGIGKKCPHCSKVIRESTVKVIYK